MIAVRSAHFSDNSPVVDLIIEGCESFAACSDETRRGHFEADPNLVGSPTKDPRCDAVWLAYGISASFDLVWTPAVNLLSLAAFRCL
jgi:hypothetical protein